MNGDMGLCRQRETKVRNDRKNRKFYLLSLFDIFLSICYFKSFDHVSRRYSWPSLSLGNSPLTQRSEVRLFLVVPDVSPLYSHALPSNVET